MSDNNDELFESLNFGEIDGAGVTLHEMFESMVRAGFNDEQAFELTKTIIAAHIQGSYLQ